MKTLSIIILIVLLMVGALFIHDSYNRMEIMEIDMGIMQTNQNILKYFLNKEIQLNGQANTIPFTSTVYRGKEYDI